MEPVRLAAVVPYWLDQPPLDSLQVAINADRFGCPEVWMGELATHDAFALAGAVARETRAVRLVVGPLPVGVRSAAALALGISSVAHLAGRPADLALGASTPTLVSRWHGRDWPDNPRLMRAAVPAVRDLLNGSRGPGGFRLRAPAPGTRIAVAAFGPRMLEAAREVADRVVLNIVTPDAACELVARARLPVTVWLPAALDPGAPSMEQMRRELVGYIGQPGYAEMMAAAGYAEVVELARCGAHPREVVRSIPDALIEAVAALGDAAAVRRRIAAYHAAGVETVAVVPVTAEDPGGARLFEALKGGWR